MAQPDSKKIFFENLSGAGKAIAVLTSGGDAQGKLSGGQFHGYVRLSLSVLFFQLRDAVVLVE